MKFTKEDGFSDEAVYLSHLPKGWTELVKTMLQQLNAIPGWSNDQICQIKEKFAGLRVYHNVKVHDEMLPLVEEIINQAAKTSRETCQTCGAPGTLRRSPRHWVYISCEEHATNSNI